MTDTRLDPFEHGLTGDAANSNSLPARFYTDPAVVALEREEIFFRSWIFVGHVSEVAEPGDYFTTSVFEQNIIVIRAEDGSIGAFYNVCRHRGHDLLCDSGHVNRIVCPYHAWIFDLDGTLVKVRNSDNVSGFSAAEHGLSTVGVEVTAGLVFVNLDLDAAPLAEQAAGLEAEIAAFVPEPEALVLAHTDSHIMKCNWKIPVENWSECYHCAIVHPPLAAEFIDFTTFRIELNPLYQRQRMKLRDEKTQAAAAANAHIDSDEQASWTVLPNLGIQIVHGGYIMTSQWRPVDADHCEFVENWYLPNAEPTEHQRELFRFRAENTQPEDVAVCEGVQRGLHSRGFGHGRLMVDAERTELSEHGSHHIQHWVATKLAGR
ncbi:MAG TPA: ring-hydroxylating oxygenase subunit alpha [Acidimicrobiaceae bacterium]|jgi:choline monooxygenase|nr:aromatic ring-hydroxylating dioxygenase subunit alpha [Actinomycetota bacterium]HBM57031.1 ring-hydroxylating oxygenase subunit alpha [Acidimicrobiaceae bacterium]HCE02585.1 ring-hydroxylating oxygenase subunit alpha [Acidobacteriota bacterium]|tara:strand:- start:5511 stop:6638 length:1128 start_codon:yes stop_codon:yes gene_type:complete